MLKGRWLLVAAGVGWLAGHASHRLSAPTAGVSLAEPNATGTSGSREPLVPPYSAPGWSIREGIGLEELRTLPAGALRTAEVALWLGTTDATGIAAWWPALAAENPQDSALLDLLMTRWMELDPQGALAVVGGTKEEFRAWFAWGVVDAEAAVKEALARKSGHLWAISRGVGQSNPRLAMELLEAHPAMKYPGVEHSIMAGLQNESWQDALDYGFTPSTLRSWSKYQPKQAFEWALANLRRIEASHENGSPFWQDMMADLDEAYVNGVIEGMPPGKTRDLLETARLKQMIDRDLEAAVKFAKDRPTAAERNQVLAEIGTSLAARDPARSLQWFREVLESGDNQPKLHAIYPDGSNVVQNYDPLLIPWMNRLVGQDPATVMEIVRASGPHWELTRDAGKKWMDSDFKGYLRWAEALPEESGSNPYFSAIAQQLVNEALPETPVEAFTDSLGWCARVSDEAMRKDLDWSVIQQWIQKQPETAEDHFSPDGPATDEERAVYQKLKELNP